MQSLKDFINNPKVRYEVRSIVTTFLSAFLFVVVANVDTLTSGSLGKDALLAVVLSGVRAGVKALITLVPVKQS